MRLNYEFRRSLLAMAASVLWIFPLGLLARLVSLVHDDAEVLREIALGLIMLTALSFIGILMSVSLRQISAKVAGIDVSASGGDQDPSASTTDLPDTRV